MIAAVACETGCDPGGLLALCDDHPEVFDTMVRYLNRRAEDQEKAARKARRGR